MRRRGSFVRPSHRTCADKAHPAVACVCVRARAQCSASSAPTHAHLPCAPTHAARSPWCCPHAGGAHPRSASSRASQCEPLRTAPRAVTAAEPSLKYRPHPSARDASALFAGAVTDAPAHSAPTPARADPVSWSARYGRAFRGLRDEAGMAAAQRIRCLAWCLCCRVLHAACCALDVVGCLQSAPE